MSCLLCHRDAPLELHHVAGAANAPRLTISACEDCHRELTARQHDAGLRLSHREPGDAHDRAWALVHGLTELLVAPAADDDPNARTVERVTLIAGRVVATLADHPIGPDPIASSAREGTRERHHPGPGVPTLESYASSFAAMLATAGQAWAGELRRSLGQPLDEEECAALLRRLDDSDGARMILRDLAGILERIGEAVTDLPGVLDGLDRLEYEARTILDFLSRVATVASDEEAARLLEAVL